MTSIETDEMATVVQMAALYTPHESTTKTSFSSLRDGSVGRTISVTFGDLFPAQVIDAERSYEKSEQLSAETQRKILPMASYFPCSRK